MKAKYLLIVLLFIGCGEKLVVKSVSDGDSFTLNDGRKCRLSGGIDAPELTQNFGQKARYFTTAHLLNKEVRIIFEGKDRYDRHLVMVWVEGVCFNELIVQQGLAHVNKRFSSRYMYDLYLISKREKRGLFSQDYILPYKFRNNQKNKK